jgi:hypothetical protein
LRKLVIENLRLILFKSGARPLLNKKSLASGVNVPFTYRVFERESEDFERA